MVLKVEAPGGIWRVRLCQSYLAERQKRHDGIALMLYDEISLHTVEQENRKNVSREERGH
jgi:hypothetical protein